MAENLNFEILLRAYLEYPKPRFWRELFTDNFNSQGWDYPESIQTVLDVINAQKQHNTEYARIIKFITDCYDKFIDDRRELSPLQMMVNRIKNLDDENLAYKALKEFNYVRRPADQARDKTKREEIDLSRQIMTMLANNKNATIQDIYELIYFSETPEQAMQIINDVSAKADEEIQVEMKKDLPDIDSVKSIVYKPRNALLTVEPGRDSYGTNPAYTANINRMNPEDRANLEKKFRELYKIFQEKYNYEKILGMGDEYIAKYQEGMEQQNAAMASQIKEQNKEIEAWKKTVSNRDTYIKQLENSIKQLEEELEKSRNEYGERLAQVQRDLSDSKTKVNRYKEAAAKLEKAGMFDRKKLIKEINEIEH